MKLPQLEISTPILKIIPMRRVHFDALMLAGSDWGIWKNWMHKISNEKELENYLEWVLQQHESGKWRAHTIFTHDGKCVGQSCYLALRLEHFGLEIGGTWYNSQYHGTKINPAAKFELLNHAFENGARRVEFKTDINNTHSRGALEKLGAKFEGVFRNHMIRPDGTMRDSAYFSITYEDWNQLKTKVQERIISQ
jgi:N-acetyltransferase